MLYKFVVSFLLTRSYLGVEFGFSLCPFGVRWWPHNIALDDECTMFMNLIVVKVLVKRNDIRKPMYS